MGLLFIDGFDHYGTDPTKKWESANGSSLITQNGRFGTYCFGNSRGDQWLTKTITPNSVTVYVGFALSITSNPSEERPIISFYDGGTKQCYMNTDVSGIFIFRNGNNSEITRHTSPWPITGGYHYLELKITVNNTTGTIDMRWDGVSVLSASSKDTQYSANAYINQVGIGGTGGGYGMGGNHYFDDFWIADDAFQGDCRVETKFPAGDGNYEQWSKSAGSHNYENIDETPPVTTDYVYGNTANLIDTYTKAALATTAGTIKGVAANIYCQKSNAGTKQIAGIARLSATDLAGSGIAVPSSWGYLQQFLSKPGGGSWAVADVNSAELGIKLIA